MKEVAARIDAAACEALRQEVDLEHKPGLVCPSRNGSHADMDCNTFHRSIQGLQGYFGECFAAGIQGAEFRTLQGLGLSAERAMFKATGAVNTHKGAIFMMGLLAGAAGLQFREQGRFDSIGLGRLVSAKWGVNIVLAGVQAQIGANDLPTHGRRVKAALGLPGAREQAADGFPVLFQITLPQLQWALSEGIGEEQARLHALVCTIGKLPDTNLAHRGGLNGLLWAKQRVGQFLTEGGVFAPGWKDRVQQLCDEFELHWLSPGGSADLLSAALFVQALDKVNSELPNCMVARQ